MTLKSIERFIHFHGILRRPQFDKPVKYAFLTVEIVRRSTQRYFSVKSLEPRSFYGYMQCRYADFTLEKNDANIIYDRQIAWMHSNTDAYLHSAVSCSLEAVFTSIINLGLFLNPGYVTQRTNPIAAFQTETFIPDTFYLKLITDEYLARMTFFWEEIDTCNVPDSSQPPPPTPIPFPPAQSPLPDVPPGTGADVGDFPTSPAYDGVDDDGLTYKPVNDPALPPTNVCVRYTFYYVFQVLDNGFEVNPNWQDFEQPVVAYGPLRNFRKEYVNNRILLLIDSFGVPLTGCLNQTFTVTALDFERSAPSVDIGEFFVTRVEAD